MRIIIYVTLDVSKKDVDARNEDLKFFDDRGRN
jgi:hypothetical protein